METKSVAEVFVECYRRRRLCSTKMYVLLDLTEAYLRMCAAIIFYYNNPVLI
jgi:hypothetical protein